MIENVWRTIGGRKFLGFLIASLLVYLGKISDQIWMIAFITYCGANVAQKIGLSLNKKEETK